MQNVILYSTIYSRRTISVMVRTDPDPIRFEIWSHAVKAVQDPIPYFESISLYNFIAPDYTYPVRAYIIPTENVIASYKGKNEFVFVIYQDNCNRKILYVSESVYPTYGECLEVLRIRVAYFGLFAYAKRFILENKK